MKSGIGAIFLGKAPGLMRRRDCSCRQSQEVTMRTILLAIAICTAGTAPALAQDKATIQKLNDRFVAAFNKGDAAAIATMYTDDAVVLPPGSEMVKGKTAIEAF